MRGIFNKFRDFFANQRRPIVTWVAILIGAAAIFILAALFVYNTTPHYAYKPLNACNLLTEADASKLLQGQTINNVTSPEISGNTATSKCSYTDLQKNSDDTMVLALAIHSGINGDGVNEVKQDFVAAKDANSSNIETVTSVGDQAFFNKINGQLNVLDGRHWLIVNYGLGQSPETNDPAKSVDIAKQIIANIPKD